MMSGAKLWRESASLIVLASTGKITGNGYNYKVLGFNRSEKTSFMPNHTVFPGGACDPSDQCSDWIKHFKKLGVTDSRLAELTKVKGGSRPPIFHTTDSDNFAKEISLRISAIRETFEELGVLICKEKHEIGQDNVFGSFKEDFDRKTWQKVVHDNPDKFLELCQKLEVVPDLWSLYEWSVWLTPAVFQRRFETAFFLVALNQVPDVLPEKTEVMDYFWKTPTEYLNMFKNDELWLPPPQFYEFSRLSKVKEVEKLAKFAKKRNNEGTTLFFPAQFRCSDGIVGILVGDDFYPTDPDQSKKPINEFLGETMESFRLKAQRLHRMELSSLNNVRCYLNFEPFNQHLNPVLEDFTKNKL